MTTTTNHDDKRGALRAAAESQPPTSNESAVTAPNRRATTDGPKRSGTLEAVKGSDGRVLYYRGKVRLADGSRMRVEIPEPKCTREKSARDFLGYAQEQEDQTQTLYRAKLAQKAARQAEIANSAGESCDAWYERHYADKVERGLTSARDGRYVWKSWVSPRIGGKPIRLVTRHDIEDIRDALDAAVNAWKAHGRGPARISGKSAMNTWSAITSAFKEAVGSKRRELRVLEDRPNPCVGVQPPGDSRSRHSRKKTFVFPAEFAQLAACEAIPVEWRELHTVAAFTYLRPGELRVLRWSDVDLKHGIVSVTRAWDSREDCEKEPKTRNGVRDVRIEPALVPLLTRMRDAATASDLVVPLLSRIPEDAVAEHTRRHLRLAGITRTALFTDTATTVQANFRSWRDSGITWLAMSGVPMQAIMSRAGHDALQTTLGYVKRAEDLSGGTLGQPFAELPECLVNPSVGHLPVHPEAMSARTLRRGRDSNPRQAFDLRPLSKRVPSATRSPLQSGDAPSTATAGGSQLQPAWRGRCVPFRIELDGPARDVRKLDRRLGWPCATPIFPENRGLRGGEERPRCSGPEPDPRAGGVLG